MPRSIVSGSGNGRRGAVGGRVVALGVLWGLGVVSLRRWRRRSNVEAVGSADADGVSTDRGGPFRGTAGEPGYGPAAAIAGYDDGGAGDPLPERPEQSRSSIAPDWRAARASRTGSPDRSAFDDTGYDDLATSTAGPGGAEDEGAGTAADEVASAVAASVPAAPVYPGAVGTVATAKTAAGESTTAATVAASPAGTGIDHDRAGAPGVFYGWVLVAAVFVILAVASGIGFYNASVILAAAAEELDASVGSVSGATGMFFAIGGLTGFLFAKRMDTVDIRWFFFAGGLVGAAALIGLRWVTSVGGLYVFFAVFGVGFSLAGLVPATTLVTRWFDRRRSVALSIASTGLSMGGIVVTPVSAWLIDRRTLSGASPYLAAIWLVGIVPIALLLVRSYPSDKGLMPDGDPAADDRSPQPEPATTPARRDGGERLGMDFADARSTRFFIALCFAYAVIFFGQVGAIAQLFKMVLERSDQATATTSLSILALTSVVARLAGGAVVLRVPTKTFSALLAVLQAVALVSLAGAGSRTTLMLSSAFLGISIGNLLMLQPLLLADAFGVAHYGRIYSFNQLFGTIGVAGGPFALGLLRDAFDYRAAFLVAAAASFLGFVFIALAGNTADIQARWQAPRSPSSAIV